MSETSTTWYRRLTQIQSASALTFSSFAVFHGVQIVMCALRGTKQGDSLLLLGRPVYQDQLLENIIVNGAATVHVLSGIGKAFIRHVKWKQPLRQTSLQTRTGYFLVPILGLHYTLARAAPARLFGDSAFVDFSLISWGLQNRALITYTLHGALIGLTSYHFVHGIRLIMDQSSGTTPSKEAKPRRVKSTTWVTAGVSTVLLAGLIVVGQAKKIPLRHEFAKIYANVFGY